MNMAEAREELSESMVQRVSVAVTAELLSGNKLRNLSFAGFMAEVYFTEASKLDPEKVRDVVDVEESMAGLRAEHGIVVAIHKELESLDGALPEELVTRAKECAPRIWAICSGLENGIRLQKLIEANGAEAAREALDAAREAVLGSYGPSGRPN